MAVYFLLPSSSASHSTEERRSVKKKMKKAVGEHLETDSFLNGEKLSSDNDTNSYVQIKYIANLHPA